MGVRKTGGFTLIELLVVVAITGLLAGIAIPNYRRVMWQTRLNASYLYDAQALSAERMYVLAHGSHPPIGTSSCPPIVSDNTFTLKNDGFLGKNMCDHVKSVYSSGWASSPWGWYVPYGDSKLWITMCLTPPPIGLRGKTVLLRGK